MGGFDLRDFAEDDFFDFILHFIRQFESVRTENFDSVVIGGIVGSGDHDPAVRTHGPDKVGNGRSRQRTDLKYIHSHTEHTAGECCFEHIAGDTGIFADNGFCRAVGFRIDLCDRFSYFESDFRGDRIFICFTADSIGSK